MRAMKSSELASHETLHINSVKVTQGIMCTRRNPFRSSPTDTSLDRMPTLVMKLSPAAAHCLPGQKLLINETCTRHGDSITAPSGSTLGSHTPSFDLKSIKDATGTSAADQPYIKSINKELVDNFELMIETMPVLPCELAALSFRLPWPANPKKMTLILDMDETLVHTVDAIELDGLDPLGSALEPERLEYRGEDGDLFRFGLYIRPHVREFLESLAPLYEILVLHSQKIG